MSVQPIINSYLELVEAKTIPLQLSSHPSLLDGSHKLFITFICPPDRHDAFVTHVLIPSRLVTPKTISFLSKPVLVRGRITLNLRYKQLEFHVKVISIDFKEFSSHKSPPWNLVGCVSIHLIHHADIPRVDSVSSTDAWIVERHGCQTKHQVW